MIQKASCAGWGHIMITDDVLGNPWDGLPAFWDDMVDAITSIDEATGPCPDDADAPLRIMVPFLGEDDAGWWTTKCTTKFKYCREVC